MYRAIFHLNTNTPITYSSEPLGLDALAKATSRRLCAIFIGINKGKAKGSQHVRRRVAQGVCLEAANCSRRYSKGHQILGGGGLKGHVMRPEEQRKRREDVVHVGLGLLEIFCDHHTQQKL